MSHPPAPAAPGRPLPLRPDRVYVGWQYALIHPHPGPQPRRPTPPEREQLNPGWVAAQQREEKLLNRPLEAACAAALGLAGVLIAFWVVGWLNPLLCGLGIVACLAGGALAAREIRRGDQAMHARIADEQRRVGKIAALQEKRLFEWQAQHARQATDWQARRVAYEAQKHWYAVWLPRDIDRIDVAGGTLAGWSAMLTMIGVPRLESGGGITVVDLTEGAVALDLLAVARRIGIEPLVSVLPDDLPRIDLGTGLGRDALADLLSVVVSAGDDHDSAGDLSRDNAILERVIAALDEDVTIPQVTAALRVLAHIGDPREDVRRGRLTAAQLDQLATMFGRGAGQVVVERAWALESQLRKLETAGSALRDQPPTGLRVVSTDRRAGVAGNRILSTYVVAALTQVVRQAPPGQPWEQAVFLLGAEKLRGDVLDRLADACESTRTGLVLAYRSIPGHVRERLGRGNAAVAFMRLGNAADAKAASEHIGTEHRFVLSQFTDTVGTSVTDTTGDSYTSTTGTSDSVARSTSSTETSGRSRGRGASHDSSFLPLRSGTRSRSKDASHSVGTSESDSVTDSINASTAWGVSTSKAVTGSDSQARTVQRSREFLVEQHELQQLPPSAMIVTHSSAGGRRVVAADANPGIFGLVTATLMSLEEARSAPQDGYAGLAGDRPGLQAAVGAPGPAARGGRGTDDVAIADDGAGANGVHVAAGVEVADDFWQADGVRRAPAAKGVDAASGVSGSGGAAHPAGTGAGGAGSASEQRDADGQRDAEGQGGAEGPRVAEGPRDAEGPPDAEGQGGAESQGADSQHDADGASGSDDRSDADDTSAPTRAPDESRGPDVRPPRPRPAPVSWRSGEGQPPPNLGPPPERLDWRRRDDK
ncbi:MAG TPA: hypothetical protein VGN41_04185 [Streptosporangiaceae bacterium]